MFHETSLKVKGPKKINLSCICRSISQNMQKGKKVYILLNIPYVKQTICFLSLYPAKQLNLQNASNAKNRFRKFKLLQVILLFGKMSLN